MTKTIKDELIKARKVGIIPTEGQVRRLIAAELIAEWFPDGQKHSAALYEADAMNDARIAVRVLVETGLLDAVPDDEVKSR